MFVCGSRQDDSDALQVVTDSGATAPATETEVPHDTVTAVGTQVVAAAEGIHPQAPTSVPQIVRVTNGVFKWGEQESDPVSLAGVNFSVGKGQLVMVIGTVGSGKSTFVNAVLGEITQVSGTRYLNGRVGYVPQQAWIVNDTVRNNITFGKPYDAEKYARVLEVCSLHSGTFTGPLCGCCRYCCWKVPCRVTDGAVFLWCRFEDFGRR